MENYYVIMWCWTFDCKLITIKQIIDKIMGIVCIITATVIVIAEVPDFEGDSQGL